MSAGATETTSPHVLIVGGGIAGLVLAAALGQAGVAVLLVDRESEAARTAARFDIRTTAIAAGSQRILAGAGIWPHLADAAEPILDIRIADGRSPVFLHYDHAELGDTPLGWIVENGLLRRGLLARLDALPTVRRLSPAALDGFTTNEAAAEIRLTDGRAIRALLLVGADGRNSTVRRLAGITVREDRYPQRAIVCVIGHDEPHHGLAVEHFRPAGPFAILPMADAADGGHRSSIVWTERAADVPLFLAMPAADFDAELQRRVGPHLGPVHALGPPADFPLGVLHADRYTGQRLALVGDAAHTIHPIAGQGINLGIRDVAALAEIVVDRLRLGLDPGEPAALARYEAWRRPDNFAMLAVTDTLNRLFSNAIGPVQLARDAGLAVVARTPPVRRFFMRRAMGIAGALPRLAQGRPL